MGSNLGLVFSSVLQSCYINLCLHKLFLHFPFAFSLSLSLQKPIEHFLLSDFSWMRDVATTSSNSEMEAERCYGQVQEGKRMLLPHNMDISHNPILSQTLHWCLHQCKPRCTSAGTAPKQHQCNISGFGRREEMGDNAAFSKISLLSKFTII